MAVALKNIVQRTARIVGNVTMASPVRIDDFVLISSDTSIGRFVHIGCHVSVVGRGKLVIHDFSGISPGCRLFTATDEFDGSCLTGPTVPTEFNKLSPRLGIVLHKHVVIGSNTVILPGVTVGEGACVGANSVVKSDLEPWTIYVGSPAKAVKRRPSDIILADEARLFALLACKQ